jgi:hypothetical protein
VDKSSLVTIRGFIGSRRGAGLRLVITFFELATAGEGKCNAKPNQVAT